MKLLEDGHLEGVIIDGTEYKIKYHHYRPKDDKGNLLSKGGQTIATILKDEKEIKAVANCSLKDTYQKKLGRIIATGRLLKQLGIPRQ